MKRGVSILGALGIGAGLMYLFDPQVGNRRRALIRDRATSVLNQSDRFIEKASRDFRNRTRGLLAETSAMLREHKDTPDKASRSQATQGHWSPTARLVSSAGGLAMTTYGLAHRGLTGTALSLMGLGLMTRGITNQGLKRIVGLSPARNAVELYKTININAPVEEVYRFWENAENFPLFMEHVKQVRANGDGGYHWKIAGPAGTPVEFDTITTRQEKNRLLSWKSRPNETVKSAGSVQFRPNPAGGTQVTVRMSYTPPAGVVGHAIAALFGVDPKQAMDNDLARLKTLLEEGRTTAQGKQVTKQQLTSSAS